MRSYRLLRTDHLLLCGQYFVASHCMSYSQSLDLNNGRTVGFRTEDSPLFVSLLCRPPKIYVYWFLIYKYGAYSCETLSLFLNLL